MSLESLSGTIEKFRSHPQFIGMEINLTDPNQVGAMGDSLLHFAIESGTLEDVEVLIAAGAKVNVLGDIGNTPLHSAALLGRSLIAKKLLEAGADSTIKNDFGETAVDIARRGNHKDVLLLLTKHGAR